LSSSCRGRTSSRPSTSRRAVVALLAGLLLTAPAGCSIGPQDYPVTVQAPRPSTPSASARAGVPLTVQVYEVQGDHLHRLTRTVPPGAGLEPALRGLAEPLTTADIARGLRSALPTTGTPLTGEVRDGVARVSVPKGFGRISVREQELAMAQLVFTITADTLASGVVLVQGSRELPVPDATGRLVEGPVTRLDYAAYQPTS
jgi:hypothetical protein